MPSRVTVLDYSAHAREQMRFRGISERDVEEAMQRLRWFEPSPQGKVVFVGDRHDGQRIFGSVVRDGYRAGAARWVVVTVGTRGQVTIGHDLAVRGIDTVNKAVVR